MKLLVSSQNIHTQTRVCKGVPLASPFFPKRSCVWSATPTADGAPVFGDSARQRQGEVCRDRECISKGAFRDSLPHLFRR